MKWNRKWGIAALSFAALLGSGVALAQQQMEGVRGGDAVQGIFGVDAETLASAIETARNSDSILAPIAGVVNMAALLAAVLLVLMTFISALMQTGEHGKVGGRYSMVWVPLRVAIAAGMLTPLSLGGYSVIQAMVLWVGMQGSGFADQAWTRSNNYLSERMELAPAVPPRFSANVASKLYELEACAAAVRKSAEGDGSGAAASSFGVSTPAEFTESVEDSSGILPWSGEGTRTTKWVLKYSGEGDLASAVPLCGAITLQREMPLGIEPSSVLQREAAELTLREQGRAIVYVQNRVRELVAARTEGGLSAEQVRSELVSLEGEYLVRMRRSTLLANQAKNAAEVLLRQAQMSTAEANGWLVAGAYYMTFAAFDARMNESINAEPLFDEPAPGQLPPAVAQDVVPHIVAARQIIPRNEDAAATYVHPDVEGDTAAIAMWSAPSMTGALMSGPSMTDAFDALGRRMAATAREGYDWIMQSALDDGSGLIPRVVRWGHILLVVCAGLLAVVVAASVVASAFSGVGGFALLSAGFSALVPIFVVGATMAYIVPALPLLIWIAGVAGWLMMLVQAVVAAPLWAAAHAAPDGEGFAGQRAMDGYMLLVSLVARPVLMIAGFVAGMLVLDFMGGFVLKAFHIFSGASAGPGVTAPGIVGMVVWIFLTGAILAVLARWSFSLIHLVPDSVLRFIGARMESFGESNMGEQARTMAIAAWVATQRGVGQVSGGAKKAVGAMGSGGSSGGVSASGGR